MDDLQQKGSNSQFLEERLRQIEELFKTDYILDAINLVKVIEKEINNGTLKFKFPDLYSTNEITCFSDNPYVKQLKEDSIIAEKCFEYHNMIKNTKPDRSYNGIETWFINEENVSTVTVAAKTLVKCNLLQLCSVLAEIELMPTYITRIHSMTKIKEVTPFRWMVGVKIKMPMFIDNREVVGAGFCILLEDSNSVICPYKSTMNQAKYMDTNVPEEDRNFKRIDLKFAYMHITPIDEKSCEVTCTFNLDPKVPLIPWFVLNRFMKEASYYIMLEFRNKLESLDMETFLKKINERKEFYSVVFSRLKVLQKFNPKLFEVVSNF